VKDELTEAPPFDRAVVGAKEKGAYYTPDPVVRSLLRWAVRSAGDRVLDPSCGDGRFIAGHAHSVGIEQDPDASAIAMQRAPGALVHHCDFFAWAGSTEERFDCAAGNPPFIRYQRFTGSVRKRAIELCSALGATFSALSSSWPLFLVATAHLVRPGGRMAFVVPAESDTRRTARR
jgi:adenine-specific DNA methylase